jgi:hypothetical protein
LHDRQCGGQHYQPVPDTPPLAWIFRERPTGYTPVLVDAIFCIRVTTLPALDRSLVPSRRNADAHLIDAPLSSTALSSQLAEQPCRVAQPVIENSARQIKKGADKRVA